MPDFNRHLPATNQIVVAGASIGIDGTVFKMDVYEGLLSLDGGAMDDTGAGDPRRKYITFGNAWAVGRLKLRGWLVGGDTDKIGLEQVGTGTELDVSLTITNTHTIPGKFVIDGSSLGVAKRKKLPIALIGMFSAVTEVNS